MTRHVPDDGLGAWVVASHGPLVPGSITRPPAVVVMEFGDSLIRAVKDAANWSRPGEHVTRSVRAYYSSADEIGLNRGPGVPCPSLTRWLHSMAAGMADALDTHDPPKVITPHPDFTVEIGWRVVAPMNHVACEWRLLRRLDEQASVRDPGYVAVASLGVLVHDVPTDLGARGRQSPYVSSDPFRSGDLLDNVVTNLLCHWGLVTANVAWAGQLQIRGVDHALALPRDFTVTRPGPEQGESFHLTWTNLTGAWVPQRNVNSIPVLVALDRIGPVNGVRSPGRGGRIDKVWSSYAVRDLTGDSADLRSATDLAAASVRYPLFTDCVGHTPPGPHVYQTPQPSQP